MKHIITIALVLLSVGSINTVQAQRSRQYDDDIYGIKTPPAREEEPSAERSNTSYDTRQDDRTYSSSGSDNGDSRNSSRQYSDDYYDSDDDYYYSSRINRFNYPFYNRPYWSSFYNPYWYDPYWVDPYWGWSPWTRPGITMSFGYGPYWSGYWGWSSWYGYPGFGAYYGYPGYGWGGGGFYSGYWNGYYAGLYNGYNDGGYGRSFRSATYGPRYNLRPRTTSLGSDGRSGYSGFRQAPATGNDRSVNAATPSVRNDGMRGITTTPSRDDRQPDRAIRNNNDVFTPRSTEDRPVRGSWNDENRVRNNEVTRPQESPRRERGGFFGGRVDQQQAPRSTPVTPRAEQQRSYTPAPSPRYEPAPSRSFDRGGGGGGFNGGGRGGGGGFGGGSRGGGGSFGGGRR